MTVKSLDIRRVGRGWFLTLQTAVSELYVETERGKRILAWNSKEPFLTKVHTDTSETHLPE